MRSARDPRRGKRLGHVTDDVRFGTANQGVAAGLAYTQRRSPHLAKDLQEAQRSVVWGKPLRRLVIQKAVKELGNVLWALQADQLRNFENACRLAGLLEDPVDPVKRQIATERGRTPMATTRIEDQRMPGGHVEADIVLPDRERPLAHDDQLIVVQDAIWVRAAPAADEQPTRSDFYAEAGQSDSHFSIFLAYPVWASNGDDESSAGAPAWVG